MGFVYIAKCVEQYPAQDSVDVVFLRQSHLAQKVHVLHKRANPLYGTSGDLPDVGETGLVLKVDEYGQEFFWLGSFHDDCENICTEDASEIGRTLFHHESDVYHQILADGTIEFSHPSGTYLKLGDNTFLRPRNRFRRLDGTYSQRIVEDYPNRQDKPISAFLSHTWVNGSMSGSTYDLDTRKQAMTGDLRTSTVLMSPTGTIVIDHETTAQEHMKLTITATGDLTVESDNIHFQGIGGRDTAVTISGTLHTTSWIYAEGDITSKGNVFDANGTKYMLGMRQIYDGHTHAGSAIPDQPM